jgi:hypothetical protein
MAERDAAAHAASRLLLADLIGQLQLDFIIVLGAELDRSITTIDTGILEKTIGIAHCVLPC